MNRWIQGLCALAITLAFAGCGQELVAGGEAGTVDAVVLDDPSPASGARAPASATPEGARTVVLRYAVPQGTLEVEASVELVRATGVSIALTGGRRTARVRIASPDRDTLASPEVPTGEYTMARATLTRIEANVTGGVTGIGGLPFTGPVRVLLLSPIVVETPIALRVREGERYAVLVDLNVFNWLSAPIGLDGVVPGAAVAAAVRLRVVG